MFVKSKILIWIFFFINVCTFVMSAEEKSTDLTEIQQEPSFFRIQTPSGQYIYFLGIVHGVPYEQLLSTRTRQELERLHAEGAHLYLEHTLTNEPYLNLLEAYQPPSPRNRSGFFRANEMSDELESLTEFEGDSKNLFVRPGERSAIDIDVIARIRAMDTWILSFILSMHYNFLLRSLVPVEDAEDFLYQMFREERTRYLETHQDLIRIYQGNAHLELDFQIEEDIAKYRIKRLVRFNTLSVPEIEDITQEDNVHRLRYASWRTIYDAPLPEKSLRDRNILWRNVVKEASEEEPMVPLLITVGNSHFSNGDGSGLINLVCREIGVEMCHLERFTAEGWIPVE